MSNSSQETKIFGLSVGADPKQLKILGGLLVVLVGVWFFMRSSDSGAVPAPAASTAKAPPGLKGMADPADLPATARGASSGVRRDGGPGGPKRVGSRQAMSAAVKEFKPSQKPDKDHPIDPSRTDPTIRFVALEKVQGVGMAGGGRSLFDFGSLAPVADPTKPLVAVAKPERIIPRYGPDPLPPPPPKIETPPPPIPLKFYGFVNSSRSGERRAFFMENEDIYIASEGEMMKNRYKLVRIGVNSAVLEDTQFKNNQQTIKLTDEAVSAN